MRSKKPYNPGAGYVAMAPRELQRVWGASPQSRQAMQAVSPEWALSGEDGGTLCADCPRWLGPYRKSGKLIEVDDCNCGADALVDGTGVFVRTENAVLFRMLAAQYVQDEQ